MKPTQKLRKRTQHKVSPFLKEAILGERLYVCKDYDVTSAGDALLITMKMPYEDFMQSYISTLAGWFQMSKTAEKVLGYVARVLLPESSQVILIVEDVMTHTGHTSIAPVYAGINELIEYKILARSMATNMYYVGPWLVVRDSMVTLSKKIQTDDKEIAKVQQEQKTVVVEKGEKEEKNYPAGFDSEDIDNF